MKTRRVFVTIEMETDIPLAEIKLLAWREERVKVLQVQANVAQGVKKKRAKRKA